MELDGIVEKFYKNDETYIIVSDAFTSAYIVNEFEYEKWIEININSGWEAILE